MKKRSLSILCIILTLVIMVSATGCDFTSSPPAETTSSDTTTIPEDTTTVAPNDTTTVAPNDTTTVTPNDTTTVAPNDTTTVAPNDTTTVAPNDTTTVAPNDTTTVAPNDTTTVVPNDTTTSTPTDDNKPEGSSKKVLLVSIDGLRPDALINTQFGRKLLTLGSYSLSAQTINPSVTLPAHMSMFHSVLANTHGVKNNNYTPSSSLKNGITETLVNAGKSCAMFYDWEKIGNLSTLSGNQIKKTFINGGVVSSSHYEHYQESADKLTNDCIEHIQNTPTDFTFLYYGLTDEMGHTYKWMSDKYYWAINYVFANLERVLAALSDDYVVIITADHGGGGDNGPKDHGSLNVVDMTIPFFIIGEGYEAGKVLSGLSILDVTPTVASLLGVKAESYWVGKAVSETLGSTTPENAQSAALEIFNSRDSWGDLHHGKMTSFQLTDSGIKIGATDNGSTKFVGFKLNRETVFKWLELGFKYVTFTIEISVDSGTLPKYIDIYTYPYFDEFFVSTPDTKDPDYPEEQYYLSGRQITLDLEILAACLTDGTGLNFIFIENAIWTSTGDAYLTFSNVSFSPRQAN